jgi:hypothetical protein
VEGQRFSLTSRSIPGPDWWKDRDVLGSAPPALQHLPPIVFDDLRARYDRLPEDRLRVLADYWALLDVEKDHIDRIVSRHGLAETDGDSLRQWWIEQVDERVAARIEPMRQRRQANALGYLHRRHRRRASRSNPRHLHVGSPTPRGRLANAKDQVLFNSVGPGAWCWFGNRYSTIRHWTFRVHWRP